MAGHSKWANIKRAKGVNDAKKGVVLTRISKDISNAVKVGKSGDANLNPILRVAIDKAKAQNMTSDRIEKAIKKGLGITDDSSLIVDKTYEAYGPGGVALLIDCETDNPNRSLIEVRTIITKAGYKTVPEGSLSWQFEEVGEIIFGLNSTQVNSENDDPVMLTLMEYNGIIDIEKEENKYRIVTQKDKLNEVNELLNKDFTQDLKLDSVKIIKLAKNSISLTDEQIEELSSLIDKIYECNDVINIWTNLK